MRVRFLAPVGAALLAAVASGCSSSTDTISTTAAGAQVNARAQAPQIDEGSIEYFRASVGDRVWFTVDSSDLTDAARQTLDRQARWLELNPKISVTIEGHADERGTREYNIALGARRANAVQAYLGGRGVNPGRMTTVSWGRERPVEVCSEERCWSKNRRTVTVPQ